MQLRTTTMVSVSSICDVHTLFISVRKPLTALKTALNIPLFVL